MKPQAKTYSCGAAAIVNALKILHTRVGERTVRALAGTTPEEGTGIQGIKTAIKELGFSYSEFSNSDKKIAWSWLLGELTQGRPIILCEQEWLHWCVAIGHCGDCIIIFDPSNFKNNRAESGIHPRAKSTLLKRWRYSRNNFSEEEDGGRFYAISIYKKK